MLEKKDIVKFWFKLACLFGFIGVSSASVVQSRQNQYIKPLEALDEHYSRVYVVRQYRGYLHTKLKENGKYGKKRSNLHGLITTPLAVEGFVFPIYMSKMGFKEEGVFRVDFFNVQNNNKPLLSMSWFENVFFIDIDKNTNPVFGFALAENLFGTPWSAWNYLVKNINLNEKSENFEWIEEVAKLSDKGKYRYDGRYKTIKPKLHEKGWVDVLAYVSRQLKDFPDKVISAEYDENDDTTIEEFVGFGINHYKMPVEEAEFCANLRGKISNKEQLFEMIKERSKLFEPLNSKQEFSESYNLVCSTIFFAQKFNGFSQKQIKHFTKQQKKINAGFSDQGLTDYNNIVIYIKRYR